MWQHKTDTTWDNRKGEMKNDTLRSTSSIKVSNNQFYLSKWTKQFYKQGNYLFLFVLFFPVQGKKKKELGKNIVFALRK